MLKKYIAMTLITGLLFTLTSCSLFSSSNEETFKETNENGQDTGAKNKWLYPAYTKQNNVSRWGYINGEGNFIIQPSFDLAGDFYDNGAAIIQLKSKYGLIDKSGKTVLEPVYKNITYVEEGLFSVLDNDKYKLVDAGGKVLYETDGSIGKFSSGMSLVSRKASNKNVYGYIDKEGKVAIEPQFSSANDFNGDKALVKTAEGKNELINKTGEVVTALNYDKVSGFSDGTAVYEADKKSGYITEDGKVLIAAQYGDAKPFSDGIAVVNVTEKYSNDSVGLINKKGEYVINPQYGGIWDVGGGLFTVSQKKEYPFMSWASPKAIFNSEGKQLTDFKYYDIDKFVGDYASATDDTSTFFIDKKGEIVKDLPKVTGIGTMKLTGDLVKANVDNSLIYMTKDGKKVWQSEDIYKFDGGITAKAINYRPDRRTIISYPQLSGMKSSEMQVKINDFIKDKFTGHYSGSLDGSHQEGEVYEATFDARFDLSLNKDLLILEHSSYLFPIGAAHGMPGQLYYHIDINTGKVYTLSDLFKKDSNYVKVLSDIVGKKIEEKTKDGNLMIFKDSYKGIRPEHDFIITKDALQIYFTPYEIGPYAAGFITFDIPFSEIKDIINTEGDFWKSFEKNITISGINTNPTKAQYVPDTRIEAAMKSYEVNIIDAINKNDFKIVESNLVKDSNLYKAQKELVPSLYNQGIKEKLVEYSVKEVKQQTDPSTVKAYVDESVAIQYPGADYVTKQYSYIYTLVLSSDGKEYKLSDIEKWAK